MDERSGGKLELTPVVKKRTYEEVAQQLQVEILEGRLGAGDKLPAERDLSEMLGVSRASVREALRFLEALEVLTIRTGAGPRSGAVVVREPGNGLANLLSLHVALKHFSVGEVAEARVAVEGWAARTAAVHGKQESIEAMRHVLAEMERGSHKPAEFNELDSEFHIRLVEASGNSLLSHLMMAIRQAVRRHMREGYRQVKDWESLRGELVVQHRSLLDAVARGDVDRAVREVEEHIVQFYEGVRSTANWRVNTGK